MGLRDDRVQEIDESFLDKYGVHEDLHLGNRRMASMHIRQSGKLVIRTFFSVVIFGLILSPRLTLAEISVDSYCQLTIQSMHQEVSNLQELIALVNQ